MKKLGNQNIYFDFIYGRTSILGRDKVSNKKKLKIEVMDSGFTQCFRVRNKLFIIFDDQ
jgi:hypothetical protein